MSRRSWLARAVLAPPAGLFRLVVGWRNRHYDDPAHVSRVGVPVVSVGNLTVGGTGKTPFVAWLADRWLARGRHPAVVSRGYGGHAGGGPLVVSHGRGPEVPASICGDEPRLLAERLPGVRVVVGSRRVAGAERAVELGADLILLDDGFQHRRLGRDLDIVLLDATDPLESARLLPAGRLREPPGALARAGLVVVTRAPVDGVPPSLREVVERHHPDVALVAARHRAAGLFRDGAPVDRPERAVGFCGIGNPEAFRRDLSAAVGELVAFRAFADHARYSESRLANLEEEARTRGATLVTTEKDAARLGGRLPSGAHPTVLRIEVEVDAPEIVDRAVESALERSP